MSVESYKHSYAKNLLAAWLRELASNSSSSSGYVEWPVEQWEGGNKLAPVCRLHDSPGTLVWRVNRGGPHWGVWTEYPIVEGVAGIEAVWDESVDGEQPSYDECLTRYGKAPQFIFDIAIQHKGRIKCAIEVVHTHPVSPRKAAFCSEWGVELYAISADWLLSQVRRPDALRMSRIAGSEFTVVR